LIADLVAEANDVARTNGWKQLILKLVEGVSRRCGIEAQKASDVGETKQLKVVDAGKEKVADCRRSGKR